MKKFNAISVGTILLLLLVALAPQLVGIKAAKADTEDTAVFRSTGGLWWFEEEAGWPDEGAVSYAVSTYIFSLFDSPPYDNKHYCNAGCVTNESILSDIEDYFDDDYTTFFIFANGANSTVNGTIYYMPSGTPVQYIPVMHYYLYPTSGYPVSDYDIGLITYGGSNIQFVFLWSCSLGSEIGSYDESYWVDYPWYWYAGTGPVGMPYAWTYRDYTQMNSNGYDNPDNGDYTFIGFEDFGIPLSENITGGGGLNYGDWVKKFYDYTLDESYTINDALDAASEDMLGSGKDFGDTDLYNGYEYELPPPYGDWSGRMRVYGNGNNYLPN